MTAKQLKELLGNYSISAADFRELLIEANSIDEIWNDIEDYEGRYQISNFGRVKSLARTQNARHGLIYRCEKIIKGSYNNGYHIVGLHKDNITLTQTVHRIVGKYFVPNPENKPEINHKYGNKANNRWWNLEWVTNRENNAHWRYASNLKSSKYIGVSRNVNGKWKSKIVIDGVPIFLGYYHTEEEAAQKYFEALEKNKIDNKYAKPIT